jgi:tetratricopeptide (TPR) repeat protein
MECEETAFRQKYGPQEEYGTRNRILHMLTWAGVVLCVLTSVVDAQSSQIIDSETQLASMLCRNPKADAANELLNKHAKLVTVTLWNALVRCASPAQQSTSESIEIYKLAGRVADRLNKPELVGTSYYYLGRTYSRMSDFESSIQAYETSRTLFEQLGIGSNLIHILADLGALYFTVEEYEKAQRYSELSLSIAEQIQSSATSQALAPIENVRAKALQTLGEIKLRSGDPEAALNNLRETLALYERSNGTSSSYNLEIADALISIARIYDAMGQYGQAFSYLNKAHQVSKSSVDQNTRANIMSSQASLFLEQEDYAAAQPISMQVLRSIDRWEIRDKKFGCF